MEAPGKCFCMCFSFLFVRDTDFNLHFIFKGAAPTSFIGEHVQHQAMSRNFQESAASPTVHYQVDSDGNNSNDVSMHGSDGRVLSMSE